MVLQIFRVVNRGLGGFKERSLTADFGFHGWEGGKGNFNFQTSIFREASSSKTPTGSGDSVVPGGTCFAEPVFPAMNRWAIVCRPTGWRPDKYWLVV